MWQCCFTWIPHIKYSLISSLSLINNRTNKFSNMYTTQTASIHDKHKREEQTGHSPLLFQAQAHWHMTWTWNDRWGSSDHWHRNTHTHSQNYVNTLTYTANSYCTSSDSLLNKRQLNRSNHSQSVITWIISVAQHFVHTTTEHITGLAWIICLQTDTAYFEINFLDIIHKKCKNWI